MGVLHALRVKSPYKLLRIEDIKIDNKPNEHGYLYLKCLIDDSIKFQSAINASASDKICVYEELEDENLRESSVNINVVNENKSKILFNGMISSIKTTNNNGVYYLEIEGITSSFELDIKEKSKSFQNANMTYDELIGTILKDYSGYNYTQCISKGRKIGKPLFQYKETDWSFLKRIASELNSELFCDIMETRNMFYFGRPIKASYEIEDKGFYKACKDLKRFHETGGPEAGHDTDYFYYEIKRREKYEVGDKIRFKNKDFYVNQYSAYALKDEVIYKYRLCRKNGIWQTKMYNSLLGGGSLEGKVLAVEGEKVKLNLDIDKGQSKEAAWFSYAPPTGNTMYSMPVVGTSAALYFPNESSEAPIVTGCVRKNGGSCAKTSDTTKRYFGTEHGSEIEMTPGALNINGGSKEPLNISFDDNTGVTLKSPKKLSLNADGEIIIKTPQNINIKAESQIIVAKAGTQSGFSVENEFHFTGDTTIEDATDRETYDPFDDEPKAAQKPEEKKEETKKEGKKEEKKKFSWGKLALAAVAAVAVVASVATFGLGATLAVAAVGAIVAGAAVGAAKAGVDNVNSQLSKNGGDISKTDYGELLKAEFWGAMTGAANMFKTELYAGINCGLQIIFGGVNILATITRDIAGAYGDTKNRAKFDEIAKEVREEAGQIRQSFRNEAPYKTAFDATEFVLNVAMLANGAKSIDNIFKGLSGAISKVSLAEMGISFNVLCLEGVTSIVSVGEISSIAVSGLAFYNMASNSGSGGDSNSSSDKNIDTNDERILGENGTQFDSQTTWQNGRTERIDVENPAPGQRPGQVHYHEPDNTKWYLDIKEKQFYNQKTGKLAPKKIQKLLKDKDFINGINKALKFLGEGKLK